MRACAILLVAVSWSPVVCDAQMTGGLPALSAGEIAEANAACESLAGMPNPPMSVQACKAMLGMAGAAQRMQAAGADPSAQRPGDDQLSCGAIFAELTTLGKDTLAGTSDAKVDAVLADSTALANRQMGEMTGFMAGSMALGAAMGAASAVMPNFVAAAIAAAWQASFIALGTKQAAEQAALRPRRDEAIIESVADFERTLVANPRFARLSDLAVRKQCEAPPGALR